VSIDDTVHGYSKLIAIFTMSPQLEQPQSDDYLDRDEQDQLSSRCSIMRSLDEQAVLDESKSKSPQSSEPSYAVSTAALCFCMLTHSYLLISVFPYSGFMAIDLLDSVNEENAGSYAGFIASAFMFGRAVSSFSWGKAADTYGRTTVLYTSLGLSCVFSILFGLAPSFPVALAFRFCLGVVNGIMGTVKTTISELADGDEKLEARGMSIVFGMWGWGFLISPAIAGALAEPVKQYPDAAWLQDGWVSDVLRRHPFLLPNLLGAACCLIGMAAVALFVRETLPSEKRRSPRHIASDMGLRCKKCVRPGHQYEGLPVLKEHQSDVGLSSNDIHEELHTKETPMINSEATIASIWARKKTRLCLSVYWAYSFVSLTVDETFPLFCISRVAGFGLAEVQVGKILSLCGLIFAVAQYGVCTFVYNRFGLYGAIRVGSMLTGPVMFLMPLSLILNRGAETGELHTRTFLFLALLSAVFRIFALVFFSSISVAVNRSVPSCERGTMNGLSVLGGSFAKGFGPAFAGFLVTYSVAWFEEYGSIMMFASIGLLGCCVMVSTFLFIHDDGTDDNGSTGNEVNSKEEQAQKIELIDRNTTKA